jgi:hypothetical protein
MNSRMPSAIAIWILFCVYSNCAGWTLSALHELNVAGYAIASAAGLVALIIWRRKNSKGKNPQIRRQIFCRRPLPAIFLLMAAMAFVGGAIYPPNNYDALTYRLPRMLNWLAAGHWIWIPTANGRMNFSGTTWEWIAMPFFVLLRSDRGLFLVNAIGFVLMPGLLFSVFRQLGVARRVAWNWMWILPLAYGYATQAGSIGNDFTGTFFGLISVYYGLRARRSYDVKDVWLAALAAALMTGTKVSNLPLLLPCLVAVWPALTHLRKRWIANVAIMAVAALISAAPIIALNQLNTGSWSGDPKNWTQAQIKSPPAALLGNGILLLQQSFLPPILPGAHKVNDWLNQKMPVAWHKTLEEKFPRYFLNRLNELPQEETAGLGLGVTLLLLAAMIAAIFEFTGKRSFPKMSLIGLAAWISILFFMLKMGSEATARLLLPYYPLAIVPILLLPVQNHLLRFPAWKIFTVLAALSVLPVVILSPSRPLWPAMSVSEWLVRHYPDKPVAQRVAAVYFAYAHRNDALAPLRANLPAGVLKIGFFAGSNDADYSLWRPFGLRQVEYLQIAADQSIVSVPGDVEWIVVKRAAWSEASNIPLETWAAQHRAKITFSIPITTLVSWGEQTWCVLHVEKP